MSESALDVNKALYQVLQALPPSQKELISYHTKFSARKTSVSKLTGCDAQKRIFLEQRFCLPFECKHEFAKPENDKFFYGVKFVPYLDTGEIWAHVEMVQHIQDGYIGRNLSNMAYMDSIVEDEDDMTNYLSVNMKDVESRDKESPQKSYNTLASQLLSPPKPVKTPPA